MKLTEAQYKAVLNLFNEFNVAFNALPIEIKSAYYDRLMSGDKAPRPSQVRVPSGTLGSVAWPGWWLGLDGC